MKKKVLLIATVQSHIGQFHKPLMRLLKENGWEIHVAARDNLAEKNGLQLEYPDKVFNIPFQRSPFDRRNIEAYKQLKNLINQGHYEVIHCNTPVGGLLGRLAAHKHRKTGTKVFYTAHGFHFYKGAPKQNWLIYYPIEKWMARYTDKLITITNEDYQLAQKKFPCPVYHIHGVGANSHRYFPISENTKQKIKQELGYKGPIIINVGELLPNKNHESAILAMKNVIQHFPTAKLLIAGNGPERDNLVALIANEGLTENVELLGYTMELPKYMQISDVEIACSYREGLPLNIMEAMLCGVPVVASHNRGHDELVENGITGYLHQPNDIEGFADSVCKILRNPEIFRESALTFVEPFKDVMVQKELRNIYEL